MAILFEGSRDQDDFAEVYALAGWVDGQGDASLEERAQLIARRLQAEAGWPNGCERRVAYILRRLSRMREVRLELVDEAGATRLPVAVVCARDFEGACRAAMREYRGFFRELSLPVWRLHGGGCSVSVSDLRAQEGGR